MEPWVTELATALLKEYGLLPVVVGAFWFVYHRLPKTPYVTTEAMKELTESVKEIAQIVKAKDTDTGVYLIYGPRKQLSDLAKKLDR